MKREEGRELRKREGASKGGNLDITVLTKQQRRVIKERVNGD